MNAIEELEKLAEEARQHLYRKYRKVDIDDIEALLPRLRTEERDGKREAYLAASKDMAHSLCPGIGWPDWLRLQVEAEAARRYPDKEA